MNAPHTQRTPRARAGCRFILIACVRVRMAAKKPKKRLCAQFRARTINFVVISKFSAQNKRRPRHDRPAGMHATRSCNAFIALRCIFLLFCAKNSPKNGRTCGLKHGRSISSSSPRFPRKMSTSITLSMPQHVLAVRAGFESLRVLQRNAEDDSHLIFVENCHNMIRTKFSARQFSRAS